MPGSMKVADLFRMRNADRLGLQIRDEDRQRDQELTDYGMSLGLMPHKGAAQNGAGPGAPQQDMQPAAVAMPGRPVESRGPSGPSSGDALSSMAPPGGSLPMGGGGNGLMPAAPTPPSPGVNGNGLLQRRSIPALDALNDAPKKRNRGLIHRRDVGRVM